MEAVELLRRRVTALAVDNASLSAKIKNLKTSMTSMQNEMSMSTQEENVLTSRARDPTSAVRRSDVTAQLTAERDQALATCKRLQEALDMNVAQQTRCSDVNDKVVAAAEVARRKAVDDVGSAKVAFEETIRELSDEHARDIADLTLARDKAIEEEQTVERALQDACNDRDSALESVRALELERDRLTVEGRNSARALDEALEKHRQTQAALDDARAEIATSRQASERGALVIQSAQDGAENVASELRNQLNQVVCELKMVRSEHEQAVVELRRQADARDRAMARVASMQVALGKSTEEIGALKDALAKAMDVARQARDEAEDARHAAGARQVDTDDIAVENDVRRKADEERQALTELCGKVQAEVGTLQEALSRATNDLKVAEERRDQVMAEVALANETLKAAIEEARAVSAERAQAVASAAEANATKAKALEAARKAKAARDKLLEEMNDLRTTYEMALAASRDEALKVREEASANSRKVEEAKSIVASLLADNQKKNADLESARAEIQRLQAQLGGVAQTQQGDIGELKAQLDRVTGSNSNLRRLQDETSATAVDLQKQRDESVARAGNMEQALVDLRKARDEQVDALEKAQARAQHEIAALKKQVAEQQKQSQKDNVIVKVAQASVQKLKDDIEHLQKSASQRRKPDLPSSESQEMAALATRVDDLTQELRVARQEAESKAASLLEQLQSEADKLDRATAEVARLEDCLRSEVARSAQLKGEVADLRKKVVHLESIKDALDCRVLTLKRMGVQPPPSASSQNAVIDVLDDYERIGTELEQARAALAAKSKEIRHLRMSRSSFETILKQKIDEATTTPESSSSAATARRQTQCSEPHSRSASESHSRSLSVTLDDPSKTLQWTIDSVTADEDIDSAADGGTCEDAGLDRAPPIDYMKVKEASAIEQELKLERQRTKAMREEIDALQAAVKTVDSVKEALRGHILSSSDDPEKSSNTSLLKLIDDYQSTVRELEEKKKALAAKTKECQRLRKTRASFESALKRKVDEALAMSNPHEDTLLAQTAPTTPMATTGIGQRSIIVEHPVAPVRLRRSASTTANDYQAPWKPAGNRPDRHSRYASIDENS
ncbi:hypothetical protein PBRA_000618 [Plasmodiophora brassicae]|nr:hypothetical protein PBRA_000618 [Plasmodiophora brassicae]